MMKQVKKQDKFFGNPAMRRYMLSGCFVFFATGCGFLFPDIYFCDDFRDACILPSKNMDYPAEFPPEAVESWRDFGHHLYFHVRHTPGIRVNQPLDSSIADHNLCYYEIRPVGSDQGGNSAGAMPNEEGDETDSELSNVVRGTVKGVRRDEKGFWCFEYLGEMLNQYHGQRGSLDEIPERDFFPVMLRMGYHIHGSSENDDSGYLERPISVIW